MPLKVAMIGAGKIAGIKDSPDGDRSVVYTHAKAIYLHHDFELRGLHDIDRSKAKAMAGIWSVPLVADSVGDLLEKTKPELVVICSNTDHHYSHLKQTILSPFRPRIVFVEKPVCASINEFDKLVELANQFHVKVLVNHTRRFDSDLAECAQKVRAGHFGELINVSAVYYGGWANNGTHIMDTIHMFIEPRLEIMDVVEGVSGRHGDDCLNVKLRVGAAVINIQSFQEKFYQLFELDFRFRSGRILLRDFGCKLHIERPHVNTIGERVLVAENGYPKKALTKPFLNAYELIHRQIIDKYKLEQTGAELSQTRELMRIIWDCSSRVNN
jgi:predicted dehydrogenase